MLIEDGLVNVAVAIHHIVDAPPERCAEVLGVRVHCGADAMATRVEWVQESTGNALTLIRLLDAHDLDDPDVVPDFVARDEYRVDGDKYRCTIGQRRKVSSKIKTGLALVRIADKINIQQDLDFDRIGDTL